MVWSAIGNDWRELLGAKIDISEKNILLKIFE